MTDYQKFATGFITQCVHSGLNLDEMKKVADDMILRTKQAGLVDSAMDLGKGTLLLGAVAPALVGAGLGHGLARATDVNPNAEVDDIKSQELTGAYQTETDRLNRLIKLRKAVRKIPRSAAL